MIKTLSSRLTVWYVSAFSALLIVGFGAMFWTIGEILDYRMDEDLEEDIEEFRLLVEEEGIERVKDEIQREVQFGDHDSVFLRLIDFEGNLLFSSDVSLFVEPPVPFGTFNQIVKSDQHLLRTTNYEIKSDDEIEEEAFREITGIVGDGLILHIGESLEEKQELMETMLISFLAIFCIVLPFSGFVGWAVARRAATGVEEVSLIAEKIHSGQLDERVIIKAKDEEIIKLSSTFNAMLDRIRDLVNEMREMTDNIAHDLKSPLTRIRILSEDALAEDKSAEQSKTIASDTIEECDRLLKMINDALDVAEAEAGIGVRGQESFDLSKVVSDAGELFKPVAEQKGINLVCSVKPGCRYIGNEQVFQRTISNLVDNAIKYTDKGGRVNLSLDYRGESIEINVADTGIGISEIDQSRVFTRFYRCDNSRSKDGCGLGLNYSRAVARGLGGDIELSSAPLKGSTFTLSLPIAQGA